MTEERRPWHRQELETARAFHAFMLYRDLLPKGRSLEKVSKKLSDNAHYLTHLKRWSSRYDWVNRATLHDEHIAEVRSEAQEQAIIDMAERQAKEGMALQQKGVERLADMAIREMRLRDAIKAIEVGAKLERIARGEPGEITKHEIGPFTQKPLEEMTDEELDEIIARRGALPEGQYDNSD